MILSDLHISIMTISFRQDLFDGRCLTILSGVPLPGLPASGMSIDECSDVSASAGDGGWKRILYEPNADFPDNYTPPSFLSSLSVNMDVRIYEYIPSVMETAKSTALHSCLIPIFFIIYYLLSVDRLQPAYLISLDIFLLISGYIAREFVIRHLLAFQVQSHQGYASPRRIPRGSSEDSPPPITVVGVPIALPLSAAGPLMSRSAFSSSRFAPPAYSNWFLVKDLNRAFLVFGTVYILSPLLRTLTRAWSSDTIIAIAVTMLIVHIIFHDYSFVSRTKSSLEFWHQLRGDTDRITRSWKRVDNSLALNAIVFSAVVLASRLNSSESVFGFIFFSMAAFSFLPFLLKITNLLSPSVYLLVLSPAVVFLTTLLVYTFAGLLVAVVFISIVCVITFVCPYLLIKCLSLKKAIKGPWDIAHVNRRSMPPTPIGTGGSGFASSFILASPADSGYVMSGVFQRR